MPQLRCDIRDFSAGNVWGVTNRIETVEVSLPSILHAAITVGHPGWSTILGGHIVPAVAECLWKACSVVMTLQQRGNRFESTPRFDNLDPSEKRGATYQLGQTISKLLAGRLFGVGAMLHLDVYKEMLDPEFQPGTRSRPDLVGIDSMGRWVVLEAKGRASVPSAANISAAKDQARRVVRISGQSPDLCAAVLAFLRPTKAGGELQSRHLEAIIADPRPSSDEPLEMEMNPVELYKLYYERFTALFRDDSLVQSNEIITFRRIADAELEIGIATPLLEQLLREDYESAARWLTNYDRANTRSVYDYEFEPDGLFIRPGNSWNELIMAK
jgi:hypothetical protein